MKKFMEEFREFALKGNVMDMAVGVIIGGAFQSIITALIDNIINPLIGLAFQTDFSNVSIRLRGDAALGIGAFISAVINFILMAFVLFCIVKTINSVKNRAEKLKKAEEAPAAPAGPTAEELLADILKELKAQDKA